jgi:hypothetical protein
LIDFRRDSQRIPDGGTLPAPLTWDYAKRYRYPWGAHHLVHATCARRHTCLLVGTIHRVATDGTLFPSYVCPVRGCDFHTFVRLLGWDPGHVWEFFD